mgnify:CR=1 FL=1
MAEVIFIGAGMIVFDKRVGKDRDVSPSSLIKTPPHVSRTYSIIRGVPFKVSDINDLKYFIDCAKGGYWEIRIGLTEQRKLGSFLGQIGFKRLLNGKLEEIPVKPKCQFNPDE